jgi:hypothetical protein
VIIENYAKYSLSKRKARARDGKSKYQTDGRDEVKLREGSLEIVESENKKIIKLISPPKK